MLNQLIFKLVVKLYLTLVQIQAKFLTCRLPINSFVGSTNFTIKFVFIFIITNTKTDNFLFQSNHDGIRHPCTECSYQATTLQILKSHKKSIHEGVRYPCDMCGYAATAKYKLKLHKMKRHATE